MASISTHWKISFYKNTPETPTGALKEAEAKCSTDEVIVHCQTKKTGRMWGCATPIQLLELANKNRGAHEVVHRYPHKAYFIVNCSEDDHLIEKVKAIITSHFPDAKLAISCDKSVYRIVLQNYIIQSDEDKTYLKHLTKYWYEKANNAFAWRDIYNRSHTAKCINQTRMDDNANEIIEDTDMSHHFITCFIVDTPLPLPKLDAKIELFVKIEKSKGIFDLSKLPDEKFKCPDASLDYNLLTPSQVADMLPIGADYKHDYTHLVARFYYFNDMTLDQFMRWINKKHLAKGSDLDAVEKKWKQHWEQLDKFVEPSIGKMKNILHYFYPSIRKEVHYRNFSESFNFDQTMVCKIPTINQTHFNDAHKCSIFNVGMGGGKTCQTIRYLKNHESQPFVWIAPNKALANNTFSRISEEKLDCTFYDKVSTVAKVNKKLTQCDKLVIVVNSLHYCFDKTFEIVIIDEIETLLEKWFGTFMDKKGKKEDTWIAFKNIFANAKKIILLDAFVTTKTLNFLANLGFKNTDIRIYEREHEPITRTVKYVADYHLMLSKIISDLKNGLKLFIFYPYKCESNSKSIFSMESIYQMLKNETNTDGIFYNADIDDSIKAGLKNVNDAWKDKQFIITNNIITCGVNYDNQDFDVEYIFVAPFNAPRDIVQVSYRPRFLTSGNIHICYLGKMSQQNAWELDIKEIKCPIYKSLIQDVLIEKKSPLKKTLQLFCRKAKYNQEMDTAKISELLTKEIRDMAEQYSNCYSYSGIKDITGIKAEDLQLKLQIGEATMNEKFELQKYFYKIGFKLEANEQTFSPDEEFPDHIENVMEHAWDNRFLFFFSQTNRILDQKEESVFYKIKEHNKWSAIFPTNAELKKRLSLTPEILELIFKDFKFKYLSVQSMPIKIIHDIYNVFFGWQTIHIAYDNNKHPIYTTPTRNKLVYLYDFCNTYRFVKDEHFNYESDVDYDTCVFDDNTPCQEQRVELSMFKSPSSLICNACHKWKTQCVCK